jgi:hypothetical protein
LGDQRSFGDEPLLESLEHPRHGGELIDEALRKDELSGTGIWIWICRVFRHGRRFVSA